MVKPRRPMEEWRAIGSGLKELHEQLAKMSVMVRKQGYLKYSDRMVGLSDRLVDIRTDLEEEMFKQYPGAGSTIFFGREEVEGGNSKHTEKKGGQYGRHGETEEAG